MDTPTSQDIVRAAEFRSALRRFERQSDRIVRASGLTPRWYLLLLLIKGSPDGRERSTVTDLAQRLYLAQSTVTELVARAEDAKLIRRAESADDARVAHLRLTAEGERRLASAFRSLAAERRALRDAVGRLAD